METKYTHASFWNLKTFADAEVLAEQVSKEKGYVHLAYDYGTNVSPRYGIVAPPKVGEDISYAFNGDYYPDGQVKSVSANCRVITTTGGHTFYRRLRTPNWKMAGGTWFLVKGHRNDKNPCF